MASSDSLGFVETYGLVAAMEAADAMVKAANVRVKTVANADAGLISVICEGDLASCGAAVDAGKAAAARIGQCLNSNLIPRPDDGVSTMLNSHMGEMTIGPKKRAPKQASKSQGAKGKK
jgi:microcompartment protein CcmL/EutN